MITPAFDFGNHPGPVTLVRGRATARISGEQVQGQAEIVLRSLPRRGMEVQARFTDLTDDQKFGLSFADEDEALSFNDLDVPGFRLAVNSDGAALVLRWCPSRQPIELPVETDVQIQRVVFHLFGLPALHRLNGHQLPLENDLWVVTLHQVENVEEAEKQYQTDGIGRLTHVGGILRKGGSSFSVEDAAEQLAQLRHFLAFVRGTWCDPVCAVGFDAAGSRVWESLSAPTNPSAAISSWFAYLHPEQMQHLYPLFTSRWTSSPEWQSCLREVIYWYVNANTAGGVPGIDVSILLSQAALERLAHQFAVVDRRMISAETFKSSQLRASDKLRLLLSSVGIPIDIPSETRKVAEHAKKFKWVDGPHAFADIRNTLVHPDAKGRDQQLECIPDGWKLGLWYLELALLAVCGYKGTYGNRLRRDVDGQVEPTPWTKRD